MERTDVDWHGYWVASATPFTVDGELDEPGLIIHGLADDIVLFGHTVRFTNALLAAARPYNLVVLSGVTSHDPGSDGDGEPAPARAGLPPADVRAVTRARRRWR